MTGGVVSAVLPEGLGAAVGIRPGDVLLEVNGHPLHDVLDVQFYAADEVLELLVQRGGGRLLLRAEREYGVPLGIDFESPTFDCMRSCGNHCEFCFVAQMPRGLRRSLYVRDDDYRYSVLYGSFITLTNLEEEDWARLEEQRLSPLYVSVHATDPALRQRLLGRTDIPDVLSQIDRLAALGIEVHTQVVLTPGVNDGEHLWETVRDLSDRYPAVSSIGIVPVGLTRYHRGGCRSYTPSEARAVVEQAVPWQSRFRQRHGVSLVYLADEWYLLAGMDVPPDREYDDYPQVENGIGLVRQFLDDCWELEPRQPVHSGAPAMRCTLACGTLFAPLLAELADRASQVCGVRMEVVPVENRLFGPSVTVSGLLSGEDVLHTLERQDVGEIVFLPQAMFAEYTPGQEGDMQAAHTLDDLTADEIAARLDRRVVVAGWMSEVCEVLKRHD
jgi:putative radical SAM enzyme (TIGR03279 family)